MKRLLICVSLIFVIACLTVSCKNRPNTEDDTSAKSNDTKVETTGDNDPIAKDTTEPESDSTKVEESTKEKETDSQQPPEDTSDEVTSDEEETTDEDPSIANCRPVKVIKADAIADAQNNLVESATVVDNYVRLIANGSDTWVLPIGYNSSEKLTNIIAIKYRAFSGCILGQLFVGSGGNPTGSGDTKDITYHGDGARHMMIIDVSDVTALNDATYGYMRYDFFQDGLKGRTLDIEYIAFFNSEEEAKEYYKIKSPEDEDNIYTSKDDANFKKSSLTVATTIEKTDDLTFQQMCAVVANTVYTKNNGYAGFDLKLTGWIGFNDNDIKVFGYSIDGAEIAYDENAWMEPSKTQIKDDQGGPHACRHKPLTIPTANLGEGEHIIRAFAKLDDDRIVLIYKFVYVVDATPKAEESGLVKNNIDSTMLNDEMIGKDTQNKDLACPIANLGYAGIRGWMGFDVAIDSIGYRINNGAIVYDASFIADFNSDAEADTIRTLAGANAIRYNIKADITGLSSGTHQVDFIAKLADGKVVLIDSISVCVTEYNVNGTNLVHVKKGGKVTFTAVSVNQSGKDWVGIYKNGDVPGTGSVKSIEYFYPSELGTTFEVVIDDKYEVGGIYQCYFYADDKFDILLGGPVAIIIDEPDPEPVYSISYDDLATGATFAKVTKSEDGSYVTVASDGTQFLAASAIVTNSSAGKYMVFGYRTTLDATTFIDMFGIRSELVALEPTDYVNHVINGDGEWHYEVIDLTVLPNVNADGFVGMFCYQIFHTTGKPMSEGEGVDISCISFFKTLDEAQRFADSKTNND